MFDLSRGIYPFHMLHHVHFHRFETIVDSPLCCFGQVVQRLPVHPTVDFHFVAHSATEQLINRYSQSFPLNIPHRLIDAGEGTHKYRTTPVKTTAINHLPEVFNLVCRVTDDKFFDFPNAGFDRSCAPFYNGFSPTDYPRGSSKFQEQPAGRDFE